MKFEYKNKHFYKNGKEFYLIGGEIAYFRIDDEDLKNRMSLFKKAYGNTVLTSIPWSVHEKEEGSIKFNNESETNLKYFLECAKELKLLVYLRLGPLVYTELINGGIPEWLFTKYPTTRCQKKDGSYINELSYLNPTSLSKFKPFFKSILKEIKPYLVSNGGPVVILQLDNELGGIHTWNGTLDYNLEAMGFLKEDGIYTNFIKEKYKEIESLNQSYGTNYKEFIEVDPRQLDKTGEYGARIDKDYHDFYCKSLSIFYKKLLSWVREEDIKEIVCANAANAYLLNYMKELSDDLSNENFFIGFDNYYCLDVNWQNVSPTPKWYMKNLYAADALNEMGYPFITLEMQLGSYSDMPPVLKENVYEWGMLNLALGMKGINYYLFAGGKNPYNQGSTSEIYDCQAPIKYDGTIRDHYYSFKKINKFIKDNKWLLNASRVNSVDLGYEWQSMRGNDYVKKANLTNTLICEDNLIKCLSYTLMSSSYSYRFKELTNELDLSKPLIIMGTDNMSIKAQNNIIEFIENGGNVLLMNTIPYLDNSFNNCTILKDYIGDIKEANNTSRQFYITMNNKKIYMTINNRIIESYPSGSKVFAYNDKGALGIELNRGKGKILYFNGYWNLENTNQVEAIEEILALFNAKKCVYHSNPNIYALVLSDGINKGLFLMNLYTGKQSSDVKVYDKDKVFDLGNIKLDASNVKFIKLGEQND